MTDTNLEPTTYTLSCDDVSFIIKSLKLRADGIGKHLRKYPDYVGREELLNIQERCRGLSYSLRVYKRSVKEPTSHD